jgi:hypothetical protein
MPRRRADRSFARHEKGTDADGGARRGRPVHPDRDAAEAAEATTAATCSPDKLATLKKQLAGHKGVAKQRRRRGSSPESRTPAAPKLAFPARPVSSSRAARSSTGRVRPPTSSCARRPPLGHRRRVPAVRRPYSRRQTSAPETTKAPRVPGFLSDGASRTRTATSWVRFGRALRPASCRFAGRSAQS